MSDWAQPCCEKCWIEDNMTINEDGEISLRYPMMLRDPEPETCCYCGDYTIIGVYIRADPDKVPYPTREDVVDRPGGEIDSET